MWDLEEAALNLVGNAGESRSLAFEALAAAKKGEFQEAENLLESSRKTSLKAHEVQTDLIFKEADGEKVELNLIMVHAQDHLMTSMLARELISELIEIYKIK